MKQYNYEKLEVYKLAVKLTIMVYDITAKFPKEEVFGLISQLRRAAVSIILNIVEGSTRNSKKDFASFVDRSIGSSVETRSGLQLSVSLKFIAEKDIANLLEIIDELFFKLQKLKRYLRL